MKPLRLLPGWMLAASLLAGQTAPATEPAATSPTVATATVASNPPITPTNKLVGSGPVRFVEGPGDGAPRVLAAVMRHPEELVGVPSGSTTLVVRPPLAYYRMQNNDTLESVALAGYFYFVEYGGQVVARARINNISGGGIGPAGAANPGQVEMAGAIDSLATLDGVKGGQYEARLLDVPLPQNRQGGVFSVIWLKSAPGDTDLIYQLPGPNLRALPYDLVVGALYSAGDFMKMIRPNPPVSQLLESTTTANRPTPPPPTASPNAGGAPAPGK
jgi:hypothetical protein